MALLVSRVLRESGPHFPTNPRDSGSREARSGFWPSAPWGGSWALLLLGCPTRPSQTPPQEEAHRPCPEWGGHPGCVLGPPVEAGTLGLRAEGCAGDASLTAAAGTPCSSCPSLFLLWQVVAILGIPASLSGQDKPQGVAQIPTSLGPMCPCPPPGVLEASHTLSQHLRPSRSRQTWHLKPLVSCNWN